MYGEQSIYANVKDHGLVSITGCCHFGIIQFSETAFKEIEYEKNQLLRHLRRPSHLPLRGLGPQVRRFGDVPGQIRVPENRLQPLHGGPLRQEVRRAPVSGAVKGTARHRTQDTAYLGNGDRIGFGIDV